MRPVGARSRKCRGRARLSSRSFQRIIFLLVEPFSKNRFVRFHSVQCLLLGVAAILLAIALKLASVVLFIIPVLGPLLVCLVSTVVALAAVVIWLVLVVKAFQGEMFKLPLLGDFAGQQAGELLVSFRSQSNC